MYRFLLNLRAVAVYGHQLIKNRSAIGFVRFTVKVYLLKDDFSAKFKLQRHPNLHHYSQQAWA